MDTAKEFPANYSNEVLKVLSALSMTGLKEMRMIGSSNIRSQLYAGDYDAMEKVNAKSINSVLQSLQKIIKELRMIPNCYIGDIKCGEVSDWEVIAANSYIDDTGKIINFNIKKSQTVVDTLRAENIITAEEAKHANELLEKATTPFNFLTARKEIRFHILRWKPVDILQGALEYRGKIFTLEDAIASGGTIKIDTIYDLHDRFTEISCVYDVYIKGVLVTSARFPLARSLSDDIMYYQKINPFKALKRFFALARYYKNQKVIDALVPILNSDLGRFYQITEDLKTLLALLERPSSPIKKIKSQIDEVRQRLGNIYQFKDIMKKEHTLIGKIFSLLKQPTPKLKDKLALLIQEFQDILAKSTTAVLSSIPKMKAGAKGDVSELTKRFYKEQTKEKRQSLGQFYTNKTLINKALETIDVPKDGLVLEPTAGTGQYVDALLEKGYKHIVANEFDELPYNLLKEEFEPKGVVVTRGDYLTKQFPHKFDLVIGNPPYFMMEGEAKPSAEYDKELKKQFGDALGGRRNIYVLSTIKGIQDLKEGGVLSYVIPPSLLSSSMFQAARDWIHKHASIERIEIVEAKDEFEDAKVKVMIFQVRKTATPNDDFIRVQSGKIYFDPTKEPSKEEEGTAVMSSICKFQTGKLDVSKVKEEGALADTRQEGFIPIIYGENIIGGEVLTNKSKLKGKRKQFIKEDYSKAKLVQAPFIVLARTIGEKGINAALVEGDNFCYLENHTIFGKSSSMEDLKRAYEIITNKDYIKPFLDKTFGQVKTITNTFLNDLPIPKEEEKPRKRKLRISKEVEEERKNV